MSYVRLKDTASIAVIVGEEPQPTTWRLPKSLLTRYSTFFATALNGEFREESQESVRISEVKPSIFELFVQWLYLGEYVKKEKGYKFREEAWVLGEFLGCAAFKNFAILDMILYHQTTVVTKSRVMFAYRQSPAKSKLRQFLVAQCVSDRFSPSENAFGEWVLEGDEEEVLEFIADVGRLTLARGPLGFEDSYKHPFQFLESTTLAMASATRGETSRLG